MPVTVQRKCPDCQADWKDSLTGAESAHCPRCNRAPELTILESLKTKGILERCMACGEYRLYRQKDLDRRVGVAVVVGGAAVFLALVPFSPLAASVVLFALALVDLGLYRLLPEVIVCYRCQARHRGFAPESPAGPFDLLTADVVEHQIRQERGES